MNYPAYDQVCLLLETPFSRWTKDDKKDLLNYEKSTPLLSVNKVVKVRGKSYNRRFNNSWYTEFEWLCGSYYLNKLFCVPCLIIGVKASVWNKEGFSDFSNATRAFHKHEVSSEHIRCALSFSSLKENLNRIEDSLKENYRLYLKRFNENVALNRRVMELPIRAALYLAEQELPFRGHDEDENSLNPGNYKKLLNVLLSTTTLDIKEQFKKLSHVFTGNSKTFQNEIIDCISKYIDDYIEKEIKECQFFSIQVDDSTDIVQKSQCSMIIRYVIPGGKLVERFMGFHDVSSDRTAETLFNLVSRCLEKFEFKSKLIGQCFDGASVMSGSINGLQSKIKEVAPQALFVHCLAHRLNLVLQQSCNTISKCRIFFSTLTGIASFFHNSAKRTHSADRVVGRRIPTPVITRWTSNSKIIRLINDEWDSFKQVFTEIINDQTYDQSTIIQSRGYLEKFNQFEFLFLIIIFNDIFGLVNILFDVLQKKSFAINFCISQIKKTQTILNNKRNEESFVKIFELVTSKIMVPEEHRDGRKRVNLSRDEVIKKYKILFYEILDTLSLQMSTRFQDMEKLYFVSLMDSTKFVDYSKQFPNQELKNLKMFYPQIFTDVQIQKLKHELIFIYSDEEYRNMDSQVLMQNLTQNRTIFKEAYKLYCLILTLPSTSVSVERSFSCLKRIKTYLRNTMSQERLTNLAKISIEKELLNDLINTQPFFDDIIDRYASLKERRIELIFKK